MTQRLKLEKGKQYRVIQPCALTWWEPTGPWSHAGKHHPLAIGDIITYVGTGYSGGSDGIHEDKFSLDGVVNFAAITCSYWGTTKQGYLEPVTI